MYKDIKNNLIEIAFELFKEQGYEKTTIMDICNACNITKTTFYRYIASKDDLYEGLFIAIRQFAKRQETWFRGMEKRGIHVEWIPYGMPMEMKVSRIEELYRNGI